jgi:hypothetical protein
MSWERMCEKKETAQCKCGNGEVVIVRYRDGDDWNRYREGILSETIECPECKRKYHIEHVVKHYKCMPWDGTGEVDTAYLVPNELTLNICTEPASLPFEHFVTFDINAVGRFTKEQLILAVKDMVESKYSTRLKDECSKSLVELYYRANKSRKLNNVISAINVCIDKYDLYEWNYPHVMEFRRNEQKQIEMNRVILEKNMKQSYMLSFDMK